LIGRYADSFSDPIFSAGGSVRLRAVVPILALVATPIAVAAQVSPPPTPGLKVSSARVPTRDRAAHSLARAGALTAMARRAPRAAPDAAVARRVALLAEQSRATYVTANAQFDAKAYTRADRSAQTAMALAQRAITASFGLAAGEETVEGGEVVSISVPAPALVAPSPTLHPRGLPPVIGPVPFGTEPVTGAVAPLRDTLPFGATPAGRGVEAL
jgi:hypothetical protein